MTKKSSHGRYSYTPTTEIWMDDQPIADIVGKGLDPSAVPAYRAKYMNERGFGRVKTLPYGSYLSFVRLG